MLTDLFTALFLLAFVIWGSKMGVLKMAVRLLSLCASVIFGFVLSKPIASALGGLGIVDGVTARLAENIDEVIHLPGVMRDVMTMTGASDELARSVAETAVNIVSFLAVVVLIRSLILVVSVIAGAAGSLPVIKQTNKAVGGVLGFVLGAAVIFLAFGVIAVIEVFGSVDIAAKIFSGSFLASVLYNNNPLLGLVVL